MTTPQPKRTARLATAVAAGAITAGAMLALTTPAANALTFSESQIETFCHLRGGTYDTYLHFAPDAIATNGTRHSSCKYRDLRGNPFYDVYINGEFTRTIAPV